MSQAAPRRLLWTFATLVLVSGLGACLVVNDLDAYRACHQGDPCDPFALAVYQRADPPAPEGDAQVLVEAHRAAARGFRISTLGECFLSWQDSAEGKVVTVGCDLTEGYGFSLAFQSPGTGAIVGLRLDADASAVPLRVGCTDFGMCGAGSEPFEKAAHVTAGGRRYLYFQLPPSDEGWPFTALLKRDSELAGFPATYLQARQPAEMLLVECPLPASSCLAE